MKGHRNLFVALGLLLAVLLVLASMGGCIDDPSPTPSPPGPSAQTLRLYGSNPLTLDPAISQDVSSWQYLLHMFSGLVSLNDELVVVPDIAQSWDISPDGTTYTFKLRQDVKFHDGKSVKAADFKYSIERACDPQLNSPVAPVYLGDIVGVSDKLSGRASEVAGVVVKDDNTLEIKIDAPKEYFLSKLTYPTAFVVDQANVESGSNWTQRLNGTGPFKLKEWNKDQDIVLERNDRYYGQKPIIKQVYFYLGGDSPLAMYEKGELDVADVGLSNVERVTDTSNSLNQELRTTPMLSLSYIGFNTKVKPFDDVQVRQSFVRALDRDKIISVLFKGTVAKSEGILPAGLPGFDQDIQGLTFDVARAQQLIQESSYRGTDQLPPITFTVGSGAGGLAKSFAKIYANNLGLDITVEQVDQGFFDDLNAGEYQLFFLTWVADYPDPENFLDIMFHSNSSGNHTGYSNPRVDQLLEEARVEPDQAQRAKLYQEAEKIIVDEAAVIPLYNEVSYTLVKPNVKGLVITPMGILSLKTVEIEPVASAGS